MKVNKITRNIIDIKNISNGGRSLSRSFEIKMLEKRNVLIASYKGKIVNNIQPI